jgi:hypothetical protein
VLARALAVLAGDVQLPRARALAGLTEAQALAAVDALVAADVVRVEPRLEFVHPLVRAAIYGELAPGERTRLHRDAARLLAAEGEQPDRGTPRRGASQRRTSGTRAGSATPGRSASPCARWACSSVSRVGGHGSRKPFGCSPTA